MARARRFPAALLSAALAFQAPLEAFAQVRVAVEAPVSVPVPGQAGAMPASAAPGLQGPAVSLSLTLPQPAARTIVPGAMSRGQGAAAAEGVAPVAGPAPVLAAPAGRAKGSIQAAPEAATAEAGVLAAAKAPEARAARPAVRALAKAAAAAASAPAVRRSISRKASAEAGLRELFHGSRGRAAEAASEPAVDGLGSASASRASGLLPASDSRPDVVRASPAAPAAAAARSALGRNEVTLLALQLAAVAGAAAVFGAVGLPWWAGAGLVAILAAIHKLRVAALPEGELHPDVRRELDRALASGGRLASAGEPVVARARAAAEVAGVRMPRVVVMPASYGDSARSIGVQGSPESLLLVRETLASSPQRELVLAHEMQHVKDLAGLRFAVPDLAAASALAAGAAAAASGLLAWAGLPGFDAQLWTSLAAAAVAGPAFWALRLAHEFLLERKADLAAVAMTGDAKGLLSALGSRRALALRWRGLARDLGLRPGVASRAFPAVAAPADTGPAYYKEVPAWAERLAPDEQAFKTPEEKARYDEQVEQLRPLARWMAHFYARLRERGVQAEPNVLTIQDLLNWVRFMRKFSGKRGWKLDAKPEPMLKEDGTPSLDKDGDPILMGSSLLKGLEAMFELTLPPAGPSIPGGPAAARDLRFEVRAELQRLAPVLEQLAMPRDLERKREEIVLPSGPRVAEVLDETPTLYHGDEIESQDGPDYVVTETVRKRRDDLLTLFDRRHEDKFFPLLLGDTGDGKSSLVKHLFAMPALRQRLGRAVPVVSLPMKEAMARRELLGGKGKNGIEYGFLTIAAMNGWVLVLEELDQTTDEFRKALNDVLHEIRKDGQFSFEVAGKTVRVPVHPHFWVVGTGNGTDGNFSITRNRFTRDFIKRWVPRYYRGFPPAEEAEIMLGLAKRWYGADFADRHGLTLQRFEKLVTDFHQIVREMVAAGSLGGDLAEPYEFNRRTLHRFLKRFLFDLQSYESAGKELDAETWHRLFAREVMEAYGAELRKEGERQAIWDHLNTQFELESKYGITMDDVALEVRGLRREGGRLVVDEKLVPISIPLRENGGSRVPGAGSRLTVIPTLARNVYRNLRNRQFREHQFSTGPTGTGKTEEEKFVAHLLGEPLFTMTLDEQTPMGELHGSWINDPESGGFKFVPGILSRAMAYDPEGFLKGDKKPSAAEVRRNPRVGATLLINEGNASPILESINPALDDGILSLSDGAHAAVAGAGFHVRVTVNPVSEGYGGYPMSPALKSRAQIVEHPGDWPEDELAEILVDQLTGVVRYRLR